MVQLIIPPMGVALLLAISHPAFALNDPCTNRMVGGVCVTGPDSPARKSGDYEKVMQEACVDKPKGGLCRMKREFLPGGGEGGVRGVCLGSESSGLTCQVAGKTDADGRFIGGIKRHRRGLDELEKQFPGEVYPIRLDENGNPIEDNDYHFDEPNDR